MFTGGRKQRCLPVDVHVGLHAFLHKREMSSSRVLYAFAITCMHLSPVPNVFPSAFFQQNAWIQVLPHRCFEGDVDADLFVFVERVWIQVLPPRDLPVDVYAGL